MTINQISVFLENRDGKLSEILFMLSKENIRIITATVADTSEYGILRMIVSEPLVAYQILKEHSVGANLTDVIAIVTDPRAGSFATALNKFTLAGIGIQYMYCFCIDDKSILIVRTSDRRGALEVIKKEGLVTLKEEQLKHL